MTGNQIDTQETSIRQLADRLSVSHTAICNAIKQLQAEMGVTIGKSQGQGKPKLLSRQEQEWIAGKFFVPATVAKQSQPTEQQGIAVQESTEAINVFQPRPLKLTVVDHTGIITQSAQAINTSANQVVINLEISEDALRQTFRARGARTGATLAAEEFSGLVENYEVQKGEILKKLGVLEQPA